MNSRQQEHQVALRRLPLPRQDDDTFPRGQGAHAGGPGASVAAVSTAASCENRGYLPRLNLNWPRARRLVGLSPCAVLLFAGCSLLHPRPTIDEPIHLIAVMP